MRNKLDYIFSIIILLLGIVHISLTPMFYKTMNDAASIFIGMGLAFVFLGVLNITRLLSNKKSVTILCLICDLIAIAYLIFSCFVMQKIEPQFLVSVFVVFVPTVFAFVRSLPIKK